MISRLIRIISLSSVLVFVCSYCSFAQKKKAKHFTDGYIIRFGDTIPCKIYTKVPKDEIGYELTFHYGNGQQITYHPGGAVKGFGFLEDGDTTHYYQMDVPSYYIDGRKNDKAFVEVVASGKLTLYRFTKIKNSVWVAAVLFGAVGQRSPPA